MDREELAQRILFLTGEKEVDDGKSRNKDS